MINASNEEIQNHYEFIVVGAVEAFVVAEANGVELRHCPAYIREWVSRAKEN